MLDSSSDYYMVRGVLLGLAIEAVLATAVTFAATYVATIGNTLSLTDWWGTTVVLSLATLLWKPIFVLIFRTGQLAPFEFKEDYQATIIGRVLGIILGLGFGITVAGTLVSAL
ncbi:hypothetical protein [Burkholderia stagnalis]|uniref:hypothetical protein n=1 Tax=Burkholderia stagnalis TaxID=1503054 RepID=UPI000F8063D4|nr:hypothetical protein [Burkholderia stagnalis]